MDSLSDQIDRAQEFLDADDFEEACKVLEEIANRTHDERYRLWALANWGNCLSQLEDHHKAYGVFQEAITIDSNDVYVLYNLAREEIELGLYGAALDHGNEVIKADPTDFGAWTVKGFALFNIGQMENSIDAFVEALRLEPSCPIAKVGLADSYFELEKFELAEKLYRDLASEIPDEHDFLVRLGITLFQQRKASEAADAYRLALKLGRDIDDVYYNLGLCLVELDDLDSANSQLKILENMESDLADELRAYIKQAEEGELDLDK